MIDRELLELAAKARGGVKYFNEAFRSAETGYREWNPLDDDGDALRLAVKLQLTICNEHINAGAAYCTNGDTDYPMVVSGENEEEVIDSDFAATRRAIVLAAAEIGRLL